MYVCNCRAINDAKIAEAHACGARKWQDVFKHCGTEYNCGKCLVQMQAQLKELTKEKAED